MSPECLDRKSLLNILNDPFKIYPVPSLRDDQNCSLSQQNRDKAKIFFHFCSNMQQQLKRYYSNGAIIVMI